MDRLQSDGMRTGSGLEVARETDSETRENSHSSLDAKGPPDRKPSHSEDSDDLATAPPMKAFRELPFMHSVETKKNKKKSRSTKKMTQNVPAEFAWDEASHGSNNSSVASSLSNSLIPKSLGESSGPSQQTHSVGISTDSKKQSAMIEAEKIRPKPESSDSQSLKKEKTGSKSSENMTVIKNSSLAASTKSKAEAKKSSKTTTTSTNPHAKSLFENLDKNWRSLKEEQACFCIAVRVLLSSSESVDSSVLLQFWNCTMPDVDAPKVLSTLVDSFHYLKLSSVKKYQQSDEDSIVHQKVSLSHKVYGEYATYLYSKLDFESKDEKGNTFESWHATLAKFLDDHLRKEPDVTVSPISVYAAKQLPYHLQMAGDPIRWKKIMSDPKWVNIRLKVMIHEDSGMSLLEAVNWHLQTIEQASESSFCVVSAPDDTLPSSAFLRETLSHLSLYDTLKENLMQVAKEMKQRLQEEVNSEFTEDDEFGNGTQRSEDGKKKKKKTKSSRSRKAKEKKRTSKDSPNASKTGGAETTTKTDATPAERTRSNSDTSLKSSSTGKKKRRKRKNSTKRFTQSPLLQEYLEVNSVQENVSIASSLSEEDLMLEDEHSRGSSRMKKMTNSRNKIAWKNHNQYPSSTDHGTKETKLAKDKGQNKVENGLNSSSNIDDQSQLESESVAGMNLSDVLEINVDCIEVDLNIARCLWTVGVSLEGYANILAQTETAAGSAVAKFIIKIVTLSLTTYANCTHVLSYLLSDDLDDIDEVDLLDVGYTGSLKPSALLHKLTNDRIQARTWMEKLRVLSADSWYTLGQNTKNFVEKSWLALEDVLKLGLIDQGQSNDPVRICYENALTLLTNSSLLTENNSRNRKLPALGMLFHASMSHVLTHLLVLKYNVWHALGVFFMEHDHVNETRGLENERALKCFEQSISGRRKLLKNLQEEEESSPMKMYDEERNFGSGNTLMSTSSLGMNYNMSTTRKKQMKDTFFLPMANIISSVETTLSSSLEYAALCYHSQGKYDESLSLFQDALILRALHQGKNSLQVASLQYNMGVVHDDLGQHEASLGRYGESLRIRLLHEDEEIKPSIILTLRCMGSVYRALQDFTNSIHCYVKAIDKLKDKLTSKEMKIGFHPDLPRPFYVLDEMHQSSNHNKEQGDGVFAIARVGDEIVKNPMPLDMKKFDMSALSEEDRVRKDIASMYTTILSLIETKNEINESTTKNYKVNNGYISGGYSSGGYSSSGSRSTRSAYSTSSKKNKRISNEQEEDKILLNAAYYLGSSSMYFGDYHTAIVYLEESLRTLWTLCPGGSSSGESSDSDSSMSVESFKGKRSVESKSFDSKGSGKNSAETLDKNTKHTVVEEGVLYHSLAFCHAMRGDHERAIRCYVTALRYYRRRLGMENLSVAGALYDCGLSYWYISEYTRAGEFWSDCVRILVVTEGRRKRHELNLARALYNLAASSCAKNEYLQQYTLTCLKDALKIFKQNELHEEVAHCHFYIGLIHFKLGLSLHTNEVGNERTSKVQELTSEVNTLRITDAVIRAESFQRDDNIAKAIRDFKYEESDSFSGEDHLRFAMSCIDDALGIYLSQNGTEADSKKTSAANNDDKSLHPLQAQIALLSGAIHDALGSMSKAIWHYTTAIRFLNRYYKSATNLYSAHALFAMGVLFSHSNNITAALKCFNDSLSVRRALLGSKHSAVCEVLFELAGVQARLGDYKKCIILYADCLRIRLLTDGYDASTVAKVLINMGIAHARAGFFHKAMECLEGALKIRTSRVESFESKLMAAGALQEQKEVSVEGSMHELEAEAYEEESELALVLHNIGNVHLKNGRFDMALKCYKKTLNLRRRHCGFGDGGFGEIGHGTPEAMFKFDEELLSMSDTLHNMGWVYELLGVYDKALSHLNECLVIKRAVALNRESSGVQVTKDNSLESAMTLLRIGSVHVNLANYDIALSYYESAIQIQRRLLGKNHVAVARTLIDMGHILWKRFTESSELLVGAGNVVSGPDPRSLQCFSESLRIARTNFGPNHACVAQVMYDLGCQYDLQGQQVKAVNCFKGSLRIHGRRYARALCRRLFEGLPMNVPSHAIATSHESEIDLFGNSPSVSPVNHFPANGLMSPFSPIVLIPPGPKRDREQYLLASDALRKSVIKLSNGESICFGLHDPTTKVTSVREICWTKLELLLLRFIEILTFHAVEPVRDAVRNSVEESRRQLDRITSHAIVTSRDTMAHQFLVLIPE